MAGASTSAYKFDSVVTGHHVCKTVWTPLIDEMLQAGCYQQTQQIHCRWLAIAITEGRRMHCLAHIKSIPILLNTWYQVNNFGTWHLNRLSVLISFNFCTEYSILKLVWWYTLQVTLNEFLISTIFVSSSPPCYWVTCENIIKTWYRSMHSQLA